MVNDPKLPTSKSLSGSGRPVIAGVLVLGAAVLVIGGLALRSAMSPPSAASAGEKPLTTASAKAIEAALESAAKYQRDGQFEQSSTILSKLVETNPQDPAIRRAYAQTLMGMKKYTPAYEQYEAALALQPPGTMQRIAAGKDEQAAQLHFEAGTCASAAGMLDRSIEHYSMAQTAAPGEAKYPLYLAMVQIKRAGGTDPETESAAMASLLRAAKLNPDLAEAWGTLAELELRRDQPGLAAQHIENARKLQPAVAKWRLVEARILNRKGEAERAATLLLALDPSQRNQPAILTVLGESYGLMRKPAEAAKLYADAFAASGASNGDAGPNAEYAYQAALWHERAGDKGNAAKFATSASMLGHADAKDLSVRLKGK